MNQTIIQYVGIDISKLSFAACICTRLQSGEELLSEVVDFKNQKTGFNQLVKWSRKITNAEADVNESCRRIISIFRDLSQEDRIAIAKSARKYNPGTKALAGAITFDLKISTEVLSTKLKWRIS